MIVYSNGSTFDIPINTDIKADRAYKNIIRFIVNNNYLYSNESIGLTFTGILISNNKSCLNLIKILETCKNLDEIRI